MGNEDQGFVQYLISTDVHYTGPKCLRYVIMRLSCEGFERQRCEHEWRFESGDGRRSVRFHYGEEDCRGRNGLAQFAAKY